MPGKPRGGSWKPGQTGNPKGRPPGVDSLAAQIRASGTPQRRQAMFDRMWAIAAEGHNDPRARVAACEWIAKHGWPEEAKGVTTVKTDSAGNVTVVHEYHP